MIESYTMPHDGTTNMTDFDLLVLVIESVVRPNIPSHLVYRDANPVCVHGKILIITTRSNGEVRITVAQDNIIVNGTHAQQSSHARRDVHLGLWSASEVFSHEAPRPVLGAIAAVFRFLNTIEERVLILEDHRHKFQPLSTADCLHLAEQAVERCLG